ncbi:MAG: ubiquinol-cytochrome c reductase iron-sulfur subunit [Thermogutta sp.]
MKDDHTTVLARLAPEPVPRRDFLGLSALGAFVSALFLAFLGIIRLPRVVVSASPSRKFRVKLPESLQPGEPFVPPGRNVVLFRDSEGVYAISLVCTHLGCIVKPSPNGFECPCHGSRFAPDGHVIGGPAPKPLPWLAVSLEGNEVWVDGNVTVQPGTKARG